MEEFRRLLKNIEDAGAVDTDGKKQEKLSEEDIQAIFDEVGVDAELYGERVIWVKTVMENYKPLMGTVPRLWIVDKKNEEDPDAKK